MNDSRPALELQIEAWRLLDRSGDPSTAPGNSTLSATERAELRATLERPFTYFAGVNRTVDVAYFNRTKDVAAKTGKRRPNVSAHLVVASGTVASTSTRDAERTFDDLQNRNATFDEAAVQDHIRKANRALRQAQHVRHQSSNPVSAVTHHRRAWDHAQAALDIMDGDTQPAVEVTRRTDPVREGRTNYTVAGTVYSVRPWTVGNVTIDVQGEPVTVPVRARNASPSNTARFATRVHLPARTVNLTVTATDSGTATSTLADEFEPNSGRAWLRLDGDGLPDAYEETVTATDPLDPDSASARTPRDEADNGTIDGREDFDGDRLPSTTERQLRTDPIVADTDEDGLHDGYEIVVLELDPLANDTDEDGTLDGQEDPDGDGLTNVREQGLETDPTHDDTDRDGLADPDELDRGTDPTVADTDEDGLDDGDELQDPFNTEPLDPDTDDDGVLDGDETYTTTVDDEATGAAVTVTAPGDAVTDARVGSEQQAGFDNDVLDALRTSHVVELTAPELSSGTVRLAYNESAVGNESDLAVYRYSEQTGLFEPLPSTVFPDENVVEAETTEPGVFVVMERSVRAADLEERGDQPLNTVNKTSFEVDESNCSGICETDGGGITIGVTSAGKGEIPGLDTASGLSTAERSTITRFESGSKQSEEDRSSDDGNITDEIEAHAPGATVERTVTNTSVIFTIRGSIGANASGSDANGQFSTQATEEVFLTSFSTAGASEVKLTHDTEVVAKSNGSSAEVFLEGAYGDRTLASVSCSENEECPQSRRASGTEHVGWMVEDELRVMANVEGGYSVGFNEPLQVEVVYDQDGDGVPDPDDLCAETPGVGDNGCPDSTYQVATLTFDKPVDRVQINASGWGYVGTSGSSVELLIEEGSGETDSLYSHEETTKYGDPDSFTKDKEYTDVGTELTLRLSAEGTAALNVQSLQIKVDTDDDGLWDAQEKNNTFTTDRYGAVDTAYDDADTDGDNLSDPIEMNDSTITLHQGGRVTTWHPISDAEDPDTDGDTLLDGDEYWPSTISVVNSSCSDPPCRYDYRNETSAVIEVTSKVNDSDTDDDGLNDSVERNRTHTDPRQEITYNVTRKHQKEIVEKYSDRDDRYAATFLDGIGLSMDDLEDGQLNDSSDDFDFVRADDGSIPFTALDGEQRSDTWLSNKQEATYDATVDDPYDEPRLDPWDPDTDDDGLTDGQEVRGLTELSIKTAGRSGSWKLERSEPLGTSPVDPDSDDDGWWDGWIGVYNASYNSRNVVLYMEHLRDEDMGIQRDEMVSEQVGVHEVKRTRIGGGTRINAPAGRSVDIDGDGWTEHSNVHLGELHWGTDPDEIGDEPDPSFSLEVDYYSSAQQQKRLDKDSWNKSIEDNFALYGIDVTIIRDETHSSFDGWVNETDGISAQELKCTGGTTPQCSPWSELLYIEGSEGDDYKTDDYLLVAHKPDPDDLITKVNDTNGFNPKDIPGVDGIVIYNDNMVTNSVPDVDQSDVTKSPFDSRIAMTAATTVMHEIGHSFELGRADDAFWEVPEKDGEIYTGSGEDNTTEKIVRTGGTQTAWGLMRRGYDDRLVFDYKGTTYFVFSLEELSTTEEP